MSFCPSPPDSIKGFLRVMSFPFLPKSAHVSKEDMVGMAEKARVASVVMTARPQNEKTATIQT